jgi:hypothetical protein
MENKNQTGRYVGIIVILILVAIGVGVLVKVLEKDPGSNNQSFVPADVQGWQTYSDERVTFRYPETVSAGYLNVVDWPPQIQVLGGEFSCAEAGSETDRAGATRQITISGRVYCVTKVTDKVMGKIYTQYAYGTQIEGKPIMMTFTARYLSCDEYTGEAKSSCDAEQKAFDIDEIAARIAETIVVK